jgi:glycosyltransferase involved in cell wall biosynthesis
LKSSVKQNHSPKTVAIIGTRGIPNRYGGFEYFAENISVLLAQKGYQIAVFEPQKTEGNLADYLGVRRIPIKHGSGFPHAFSKLAYGYNSLKKAKKLNFDTIICCGHSPALFFPLFCKDFRNKIIVNPDGIEWKREKWGIIAKAFLRLTERIAIKNIKRVVADNEAICDYIRNRYNKKATHIAYGVNVPLEKTDTSFVTAKNLTPNSFGLCIARFEPENSIELILKSFLQANKPLVIVGEYSNTYGKRLYKQFGNVPNFLFWGPEYDTRILNSLRSNCSLYVHGHSVGGTNPSLLQAMASGCNIVAHNNPFNQSTLKNCGNYFSNQEQLTSIINEHWDRPNNQGMLAQKRAIEHFSWEQVTQKYIELIELE